MQAAHSTASPSWRERSSRPHRSLAPSPSKPSASICPYSTIVRSLPLSHSSTMRGVSIDPLILFPVAISPFSPSHLPPSFPPESHRTSRTHLPLPPTGKKLLYLLERYAVLIVIGQTGCGKTTQLPQYALEAGWAREPGMCIACTQPRRISATTVAQRVAQEVGTVLGDEVRPSVGLLALICS